MRDEEPLRSDLTTNRVSRDALVNADGASSHGPYAIETWPMSMSAYCFLPDWLVFTVHVTLREEIQLCNIVLLLIKNRAVLPGSPAQCRTRHMLLFMQQ